MSTRSIYDPVIDPGIRHSNYFEGRLLTANTLRDDQKAQRERQRLLGRAIGTGVVEGLNVITEDVTIDGIRKTITISPGYAINGEGELLALKQEITADVIPRMEPLEPTASLFTRCKDAERPQPSVPVGVGLYVLIMSPASGYRDRAPKSGLGSEGKIIGCGDRYAVDGVQFRLEPLQPSMISGADYTLPGDTETLRSKLIRLLGDSGDLKKQSKVRNLIAHLCFGTTQTAEFVVDPFARSDNTSAFMNYGALDDLRRLERLTDCDVPLGLFLWNDSGIAFLDIWAVRRRPTPPTRTLDWPLLINERKITESEARFMQFQAQFKEVIDEVSKIISLNLAEYFYFLPPVGFLFGINPYSDHIPVNNILSNIQIARGPMFIEGARLRLLLKTAIDFPYIDLSQEELVWLYMIRENAHATYIHTSDEPYVIFVNGHVPYFGEPHFDTERWDYSNYSMVR